MQADCVKFCHEGQPVVRWVRRAVYFSMSASTSTVCTIGCVHTMLRDRESHIKMGSPGAYSRADLTFAAKICHLHEAKRALNFIRSAVRS